MRRDDDPALQALLESDIPEQHPSKVFVERTWAELEAIVTAPVNRSGVDDGDDADDLLDLAPHLGSAGSAPFEADRRHRWSPSRALGAAACLVVALVATVAIVRADGRVSTATNSYLPLRAACAELRAATDAVLPDEGVTDGLAGASNDELGALSDAIANTITLLDPSIDGDGSRQLNIARLSLEQAVRQREAGNDQAAITSLERARASLQNPDTSMSPDFGDCGAALGVFGS